MGSCVIYRTTPKFAILGAAGCGKTYIAIEQARRCAAAGDRVLSLCLEEPLHLAGLDGVPVRYVESTNKNAIEKADEVVNQLLNDGWAPGDICVLTTGSRHPTQREKVEANRHTYWDEFFEGNAVFYGHVLGFKGLERRVIVLAINGWKVEDQKKEMLYTAITRARDLLIICADKETLKHGGGKEFVKKLTNHAEKSLV